MGAPELPDPGEEDLRPTEPIQHPPIVSDESDNEYMDAYDGYQPLPIDESEEPSADVDAIEDTESPIEIFSNLTPIERTNVEITREIWNAPRPAENQIELDTTRTAQILSAMANFTLPNAMIPEWAIDVPEEHWKEELLQRIRHRKAAQENINCNTQNENNELQD